MALRNAFYRPELSTTQNVLMNGVYVLYLSSLALLGIGIGEGVANHHPDVAAELSIAAMVPALVGSAACEFLKSPAPSE